MKTKTSASFIAIFAIAFGFAIILQLSQTALVIASYLAQHIKETYGVYLEQTKELVTESYEELQDIIEFEMIVTVPPVEVPSKLQHALQLVASGMSQRQSAKMAGIPQTTISRAINSVKR